jgi:hypothetical protein
LAPNLARDEGRVRKTVFGNGQALHHHLDHIGFTGGSELHIHQIEMESTEAVLRQKSSSLGHGRRQQVESTTSAIREVFTI